MRLPGLLVLRCPEPLEPWLELPEDDEFEDEVELFLRAPLLRAALCERFAITYLLSCLCSRADHGGLWRYVACGLDSRSHRAAHHTNKESE